MTPQEQQQLNKLLQEGIELAKKLGDTAAETSLRNFNGDLKTAQLAVKSLKDEWKEYINDISGAREGFTRIVDEIKNMNSGAKIARSSFSSLASVASKLQSHQENITFLTSKELQSLKSKSGDRFNDLLLAGKLAKGVKITDPLEVSVVNAIGKNKEFVQGAVNNHVKALSQQAAAKTTSSSVKSSLLGIAKTGLTYGSVGVGYEYGYDAIMKK